MLPQLILALATTALTSPLPPAPHPQTSLSKTFNLVINVTSSDFTDSPVHGTQLTTVHVGAGQTAPIPAAPGQPGSGFFSSGNGTVRLDIAGSTPYAFIMADQPEEADPTLYDLGVSIGEGTVGFGVSGSYPTLRAPRKGSFVVCDLGFEAYAHPKRVLEFVEGAAVPGNCVAVNLLPQCDLDGAVLDGIPETQCYVDVAAIDWSEYSAC